MKTNPSNPLVMRLQIAVLFFVTVFSTSGSPIVIDMAINPANGHVYYLLDYSDWTNAENVAIGLGGHLATIRNLAENNWLWDRWGTNRDLWIGLHDPNIGDGSGAQHAADFVWASGEASSYRNWNSGEPNNTGGAEYFANIIMKGAGGAGFWNDSQDNPGDNSQYGVAEVPFCTPHHATAIAILYNTNFVVGATITDAGCGYTNAPQVTIQGGGGSGATATATINSNGMVTAINIITTGSGYTNAPQILIASPPFVPTLSIAVSAVKVTQHLMEGFNYVIESSSNLINWTDVGPSFTATNEYMVNEFEIEVTGQYFRVRQVP